MWHCEQRMSIFRRTFVSLLVTLAVWALFSWPLPRYVSKGIPSSSLNTEKGSARAMIPGDHLQLLYQFWLTGDMLKGRTPPFHNIYEFNVGNDADRKFQGTGYAPFSLFYIAAAAFGGQAFGYNFAQIMTLWLTLLFTWLLVRRYCRDDLLSGAAALIAVVAPYPWITMFDGSPTGLAMMWIPIIFWGLDVMVADRKMWGGAVAGLGIYLAESDTHVFFFAVLSAPFWCVFSYLHHSAWRWPSRKDVASLLKASLLLLLCLGFAAGQAQHIRHGLKKSTVVRREIGEITLSSPPPAGLFDSRNAGEGRRIYVGKYLAAILLAGLGAYLWQRVNRRDQQPAVPLPTVLLLGLAIVGVALLATGARNPAGPGAWRLFIKLIPPYAMIRQPHKIYCLMPVLLALAAGVLWPSLVAGLAARWKRAAALALVLPLVFDYSARIHPTVCLLQKEQGAFRAIADDAKAAGNPKPHLLSLPLWPGDSHYDSVNEHLVSLYHIRMINGYGGTVKTWFRDEIFLPLESMNVGGIYDPQLDALLQRGCGYLVLHEDCFPEKVSPFPVGYTLQALLNQPRLKSIGKDGSVWAFKILPADQAEAGREKVSFVDCGFPTKRREFERGSLGLEAKGLKDPSASGGGCVTLSAPGATTRLADTQTALDLPLAWLVRARGTGTLAVATAADGRTHAPSAMAVDSAAWRWLSVPLPVESATRVLGTSFTLEQGSVDLDSASLVAGTWVSPAPGETIELSAASFFHAGYTAPDLQRVFLRKDSEPAQAIFYGPSLPIEPGEYLVELAIESAVPRGTPLGRLLIRGPGGREREQAAVTAGEPARLAFRQADNLPFSLAFDFGRTADLAIRSAKLTRVQ
jgi:hypothetical protein